MEGPKDSCALYEQLFSDTVPAAIASIHSFKSATGFPSTMVIALRTVFLTVPAADASIIIKHRPGSEFAFMNLATGLSLLKYCFL